MFDGTGAPLLVVEDDRDMGRHVEGFLTEQGFAVTLASNVPEGRQAFETTQPELCLLDIVMPGPTGRVFCREIAEASDTAVIMMSSLSDTETVISLLEMGADDYIVKPFSDGELLARIRSVLRRKSKRQPVAGANPTFGAWSLEAADRRLRHGDGYYVKLTGSETELLRFMLSSPGTVFTREDLMAVARTRTHGGPEDRALDNMIRRLRKKIEDDPSNARFLVSVWGKGYRLEL